MRFIYRKCFFILLVSCCICSSNACPTSCYCQAVSEGGNVDCNTKGLNIVPTNIPTYVKKLYLFSNSIEMLNKDSFSGLISLNELYLYSNSIKDVNREVFSDLTNLEILQLGDNVIGNLDSSFFENLDKLTNLHLQQNNITTLPENVFSNLKSLQVLYLYENSIQEYDTDGFKGLHQLRELYLQNNRLSNLTTNVFIDLQLMEILDVSQNQLQSLPSTVFSNLTSLRILYIYSNFITTISEHTFWNLDNLEQIDIYDNKISTIENSSFGDLPALTKIQLHYNLITCDCYVRWFRDWLLSRPTLGTAYATCKTSGIYITDVTDDTFEECNGKKPCPSGWTGQNCDVDIEPPIMFDCPANMTVFTSELTKTVDWSVPEFIDPNNESLEVFTNYPEAKWTFPWGDFNVSYPALRPSNGLRTECLFEIRVRPYPCNDIGAPINGAILCNNWRKDYGQFCIHLCQESYTVGRGINPNNIYVCGASGSWLPGSDSPDCNAYPCNDIGAPINGAILCNNWRKDYGQFCIHLCQESYTVGRGINPNNIYVCGASGSWLPGSDSPDCNAYPCNDIGAPINGAILCNNWRKDYGQFCIHLCQESYTVGRGINPNNIYVCGASGSWLPGSDSPDCNDMYRCAMLFLFCTLFILPLCQAHVKGWFWGGGGGGSSGVTAKKIADKANSYKDSTEWAFEGCKGGKKFCKSNKCNLFVNDVLKSVGATVPQRYSWWYSPISANDWGNQNSNRVKSTGCYSLVSSFWSKQRGDVIAFPASSGSGHVGIVYDGNAYISAGKNQVNKKRIPSVKSTIWRYKYDDNNC